MRHLVCRALRAKGYRVVEAPHAEAALVLASAMNEPIHLLLSDLVMPGIGGLLLAERMVSSRPAMQVLFITGYAPEAVDRHGELAAAGALLREAVHRRPARSQGP